MHTMLAYSYLVKVPERVKEKSTVKKLSGQQIVVASCSFEIDCTFAFTLAP